MLGNDNDEKKTHGNPWLTSPLLIVHGSAGSGRINIIDVLTQMLEKIFSGDDPNHPYILKLALTCNAASVIKGQTIHSAFQLPFNNGLISVGDKIRDKRSTTTKIYE